MFIELTEREVKDILSALDTAMGELTVGEGFPEATAYNDRMLLISERMIKLLVDEYNRAKRGIAP